MSRIKFLLLVLAISLGTSSLKAQEVTDYLKHNKEFYICWFKRECSNCYDCGAQRYVVKIKNRIDKKITDIKYVYYSEAYNKVMEKYAKLEGKQLDNLNTGRFYVCVPTGRHWAISEVKYEDGTTHSYFLNERLENFYQEPDECDCNETTYIVPPRS